MTNITITQNLKSWEYGLFKAAKVLGYITISSIVAYTADFLTSYHPSTNIGIAEVALANVIIVYAENWINANKAIKQAQVAPVSSPIVPLSSVPVETPPAG